MGNTPSSEAKAQQASSCPVPESQRNLGIFNVYNQRVDVQNAPAGLNLASTDILDPKNNMPLEPNQQPCPGQKKLLSTNRIHSTIPKGGTESTWVYPSPQMFYNGTLLVCTVVCMSCEGSVCFLESCRVRQSCVYHRLFN